LVDSVSHAERLIATIWNYDWSSAKLLTISDWPSLLYRWRDCRVARTNIEIWNESEKTREWSAERHG